MEFKIIDETAYGLYQDMDFESVTRWDKNHWKCETTNGFFLNIKIKGGTLYADLAETEYQLGYNAVPIIKYIYKIIIYFYHQNYLKIFRIKNIL